jgi:alpha-L-fucosidase
VAGSANFNEGKARPYTAEDIRFTTKGDTLYAFVLGWPADGKVTIKTLAAGSEHYKKEIDKVEILGADGTAKFDRGADGLIVMLPEKKPNEHVCTLKIHVCVARTRANAYRDTGLRPVQRCSG